MHTNNRSDNTEPADLANRLGTLNVSDNRVEFASLLLLYHFAHSDSRSAFQSTLLELTAPSHRPLRSPFSDDSPISPSAEPFLPPSGLSFAIQASRTLAPETFSPLAYFALLNDASASKSERTVLSWAEGRVRERAWAMMQRAYLEMSLEWVGRLAGYSEEEVLVWVKGRGGKIEGKKVRLR